MNYNEVFLKLFNNEQLDEQLLTTAFTHSSIATQLGTKSNEILEFLGDSIINFLSTKFLLSKFENATEGDLSKYRASLVCTKTLALASENLNLTKNYKVTGSISSKMKADLFEAFIGAVYLSFKENKEDNTYKFLDCVLFKPFNSKIYSIDYKTKLQEKLQERGPLNISYVNKLVYKNKQKMFEVALVQNGKILGVAIDKSIKLAEQEVAKEVLSII